MATILSFRGKESDSSAQEFLTDETEKLSFRTAEDGAVSLGDVAAASLPDILPDPKRDWSNQELADLFRVKQLLSSANVPVETMRGVTDEGDPWFIFCHLNGDVFIHMARIDGTYVLDSPNVRRPLRGHNFNALIADYTNHALPAVQGGAVGEEGTEHRVVRFERGSKVRLHPSAMLAALIWTLFLASEELVMLAPEEQAATSDDLLDFSAVISADLDHQTLTIETADLDSANLSGVTIKTSHEDDHHSTPEAQLQMREITTQQGLVMHQNAYAMGLSTIAIAMGFMSEAVLLDNQRKVLDGLKEIGFTQYTANADGDPQLDQIAGEGSNALLEILAEFLGIDLSLNTEMAAAPSNTGEVSLLQQEILHATQASLSAQGPGAPFSKTVQAIVREDADTRLSQAPSDVSDATQEAEELFVMASAAQDLVVVSISDIMNRQIQLEEYQWGQATVKASFNITNSDGVSWSDYIFFNHRTTNHREFDERAQSFIEFIQGKETEVGIITIGNEVIMIDRDAVRSAGAETYSFSWETQNGQLISMIGLKSEFQEFDLIA
ncbi:MAG: hypothetical protein WA782_04120 [Sulfitobacter sp.]